MAEPFVFWVIENVDQLQGKRQESNGVFYDVHAELQITYWTQKMQPNDEELHNK